MAQISRKSEDLSRFKGFYGADGSRAGLESASNEQLVVLVAAHTSALSKRERTGGLNKRRAGVHTSFCLDTLRMPCNQPPLRMQSPCYVCVARALDTL